MKTRMSVLVFLSSLAFVAGAATDGPGATGVKEAQTATVMSYPAPEGCNTVRFLLKAGTQRPGPKIVLSWGDAKDVVINVQTMSTNAKITVPGPKPAVQKDVVLDEQYVAFGNIKDYVRPNLKQYTNAQQNELYGKWAELPRASEHIASVEFRRGAKGWEFWLEGCYSGLYDKQLPLKNINLQLTAGSAASDPVFAKLEDLGRYLPLDMAHIATVSAMKDAALSLADGKDALKGIPIKTLDTGESGDVGRVKECRGNELLEVDQDLSRSPLDGMPEHLHYSVPLAQYIRAWVLCAAEDAPQKEPILTARLTRFSTGGRGEAIADTSITLPRGNEVPSAGITRAGTVTYMAGDRNVTVPLWLCEVPLKVGEIQDLLWGDRKGVLPLNGEYLDFEFLGKLGATYLRVHKPDPKSVSAVHVFGVTLERSPVVMDVRKTQVANIFDNDEKPEMQVALQPFGAGDCRLTWEIRDIDGKTLDSKTETLSFAADAPERIVPVSLAMKELGWYSVDFTLTDQDGRQLVRHPASFVLLGPDTRKAGHESPYMTWWFGNAHLGTADPKIGGAMLMKMGVRRSCISPDWHGKDMTEQTLAPWKLTLAQIRWMGRYYSDNDWVEGPKRQEAAVRELCEQFPHCRTALLFHESYSYYLPPELRDAQPTPEEMKPTERDERAIKLAYAVSGVYREKFPDVKIQLGNGTNSAALIAMLLRNKFPRDRFDCLGLETVGMGTPPESSVMVDAWLARETARKFGYDVPASACFEFTCRDYRVLGLRRQAEYHARDILLCHGLGYAQIGSGELYDPGNAYFGSYYGGMGACQRYPLLYPRPAFAAIATLTRVLDQARLRRQVPLGSQSVYALEFERGKETVYALWAPCGEVETTMTFGADGVLTVVDVYGRSREVRTNGRKIELAVGSAASYVLGSLTNAQITVVKRTFPGDQPPAGLLVASRMDRLGDWELKLGEDERVHRPDSKQWPVTTNGNFALRQVDDPEKGACLELELKPDGKLPDITQEYAGLKLKDPKPLPGEPSTLGIWVNGNSSWGHVLFEFEDANGEQWLSVIRPSDPSDRFSLNFDGWRFMSYPITNKSALLTQEIDFTGAVGQYWTAKEDRVVQYPITLTGLVVCYPRKAVHMNDMEPVRPTIRLKDMGAYE